MAEKSDEEKKEEEQRASDAAGGKISPENPPGDETPAGYLGRPGGPGASGGDEAKTVTLDDQAHAKPLDPKMAGPDAQREEKEHQTTRQAEQRRQERSRPPTQQSKKRR